MREGGEGRVERLPRGANGVSNYRGVHPSRREFSFERSSDARRRRRRSDARRGVFITQRGASGRR